MLLLVADTHWTDNPKDIYRFGLFNFLEKNGLKHKVHSIVILGDITQNKDKHSSILVNKIISGLTKLAKNFEIYILMGNHDYTSDPTRPFFKFLHKMRNIKFITTPTLIPMTNYKCLFLPHQRDTSSWNDLPYEKADYIFIHQTVDGAIAETGSRMRGIDVSPLAKLDPIGVYSGDIHRPQVAGFVTYVGSPYPIRFGDSFKPRVLLLDETSGGARNLYFPCPKKLTIEIGEPEDLLNLTELKEKDQVKITINLTKEEFIEWKNTKQKTLEICKKLNLEVFGVNMRVPQLQKVKKEHDKKYASILSPVEALESFCIREKLSAELTEIGKDLLLA